MNSIFAIASITIRNAIRSKIVIVLLLFLLATLIGFPLTIRGDGTMSGEVRLLIQYTLGLATLILSIATVWAACASISTEIRYRNIQMIMSKPVHAYQLWLGKWLGLTAMNAALLILCVSTTYGALRWITQPEKLTQDELEELHTEILAAHRPIAPRHVDLEDEILRRYNELRTRSALPEEIPASEILAHIERNLRAEIHSVPSGVRKRWIFDVPHIPPADHPPVLRYRFSSSILERHPIRGVWTAGDPEASRIHRETVDAAPLTWHTLTLSPDLIAEDGTLTMEFANINEQPVTILFDSDDGLRLMLYEGGFLPNYLRATLLILFHLAFLCAIGVTAGAFFSLPVAALTSFYSLLLLYAGRFIGGLAETGVERVHGPSTMWLDAVLAPFTHMIHVGLNLVIQPVYAPNPLDFVAVGEWIGWGEVGTMFLIKVLIYSGVLMALSVWHMARKEVALPS